MGQLKVEEKKEFCEGCKIKFSDYLPYHAMNRCMKCYMSYKQPRKYTPRVNSKERFTHCLECKYEFDKPGHKDKMVIYASSGLCRRCYGRMYHRNSQRFCEKCERPITNSAKPFCRICLEIERDEYYKNNPKVRKSKSYKDKLKVLQTEISDEQFELIRRLLTKFKLGMYSMVDYFIIAGAYVDIYDHEAHLDAYSEDEQIIIMLKRLKEIWLHNKEIKLANRIKEHKKLQLKTKKLLKN